MFKQFIAWAKKSVWFFTKLISCRMRRRGAVSAQEDFDRLKREAEQGRVVCQDGNWFYCGTDAMKLFESFGTENPVVIFDPEKPEKSEDLAKLEAVFNAAGYITNSIAPMGDSTLIVLSSPSPFNILTAVFCVSAFEAKRNGQLYASSAAVVNMEVKYRNNMFYYGTPDAAKLLEETMGPEIIDIEVKESESNEGENATDNHFDECGKELNKSNLKTQEDLENLVKPLIRKATKVIVKKHSVAPENSQLMSHFGGQPYFEKGEKWPKAENGNNLEFVFQIFNENDIVLPENIKLVQFYYDMDDEDGWLVKIYESLHRINIEVIEKPEEHNTVKYCNIEYESIQSLPDWDGIERYSKDASKLSCMLDEDEPWRNYQEIAEKLVGKPDLCTQLGGYPNWIQNDENIGEDGFELLFQLDSEEEAGLMWGDCGMMYVFYNKDNKKTNLASQCY